jgi:hypothetical protein
MAVVNTAIPTPSEARGAARMIDFYYSQSGFRLEGDKLHSVVENGAAQRLAPSEREE